MTKKVEYIVGYDGLNNKVYRERLNRTGWCRTVTGPYGTRKLVEHRYKFLWILNCVKWIDEANIEWRDEVSVTEYKC